MPRPRLVSEFAPQSGVILTWPHPDSDWQDSLVDVESVYLAITCAISRYERVLLICYDDRHVRHVSKLLDNAGISAPAIRYVAVRTNDTWVRDYGPLSVAARNGISLQDFTFDGWGGKHESVCDNKVSHSCLLQGLSA